MTKDLSLTEKKRRLRKMEDLFKHEGWHLLKDLMQREMTQFALSMGDDQRASPDVMRFQCGILRASKEFLAMEDRILFKMRSDIQIEEATKPTSPAKAG